MFPNICYLNNCITFQSCLEQICVFGNFSGFLKKIPNKFGNFFKCLEFLLNMFGNFSKLWKKCLTGSELFPSFETNSKWLRKLFCASSSPFPSPPPPLHLTWVIYKLFIHFNGWRIWSKVILINHSHHTVYTKKTESESERSKATIPRQVHLLRVLNLGALRVHCSCNYKLDHLEWAQGALRLENSGESRLITATSDQNGLALPAVSNYTADAALVVRGGGDW